MLLELAARRVGNLGIAIGITAVGVLAAGFGEADDAPGLVLIASACVLGVRARTARSR